MGDSDSSEGAWQDRVSRSGRWRTLASSGTYAGSRGRTDEYVELLLDEGRFDRSAVSRAARWQGETSIRTFDGGRGLAILRLISSADGLREPSRDWLADLTACAALVVPHLELDPAVDQLAAPAGDCVAAEATVAVAPATPIEDRLREQSPPSDEWVDQAAAALDQNSFKIAERLGRQALADHDPYAQEFLDVVRLIRRGSKLARRWPRDPQVHLDLAKAYFCAEAGAAAVREATEALRLDASLGECHAVLGFELLYRGDVDGARTAWDQARALAPGGEWQAGLGNALLDASLAPPGKIRRGTDYVRRQLRDIASHVRTAFHFA